MDACAIENGSVAESGFDEVGCPACDEASSDEVAVTIREWRARFNGTDGCPAGNIQFFKLQVKACTRLEALLLDPR